MLTEIDRSYHIKSICRGLSKFSCCKNCSVAIESRRIYAWDSRNEWARHHFAFDRKGIAWWLISLQLAILYPKTSICHDGGKILITSLIARIALSMREISSSRIKTGPSIPRKASSAILKWSCKCDCQHPTAHAYHHSMDLVLSIITISLRTYSTARGGIVPHTIELRMPHSFKEIVVGLWMKYWYLIDDMIS